MSVQDFKIDPDSGDMVLQEDGFFSTVEDNERVAQACKIRLRTQAGEWILDTSSGLDYLGEIFIKGPDFVLIRARVVEQLRQVPDVREVQSVELEPTASTRELAVNFVVRSSFGPAIGSV